jgi:murein DD-endopeptidase MepM/ murein hydrolase activator NlpD
MTRRLALGTLLLLTILVPAASGQDLYSRKQNVDSKISTLQARANAAEARERELEREIAAVTTEIRGLEREVSGVSEQLAVLEHDLALHKRRLARLTELFELQTERLTFLRGQHEKALVRMYHRVIDVYEGHDVGALEVVLSSSSFTEILDQLEYVDQISNQDRRISEAVREAKLDVRAARARTRRTRTKVASATRVIAARTAQVRQLRDELLARQNALAAARSEKAGAAAHAHETAEEAMAEIEALEEVSAQLGAQIRASQSATSSSSASSSPSSSSPSSSYAAAPATVSSSGFVWPVSGPVVSGFGYRCLAGLCRMHEGIDISAGSGTPIVAVAAGTVIYAGSMGGYGNIIVIDHGGGLSTAYAHQTSFAVGGGARVGQGQVIGYVGCTGRCFGPHLHFEVRVNGSPVDPLGYL